MINEIAKQLSEKDFRRGVILKLTEQIKCDKGLIFETDDCKNALLHHIVKYEYTEELIKLLVEKGADLKVKNAYGDTPLHIAAGHSVKNAVLLMQLGAKDNVINNDLLLPEDIFHETFRGTSWFDIMPTPKVIFKGSHYEIVSSSVNTR